MRWSFTFFYDAEDKSDAADVAAEITMCVLEDKNAWDRIDTVQLDEVEVIE